MGNASTEGSRTEEFSEAGIVIRFNEVGSKVTTKDDPRIIRFEVKIA